MSKSKLPREILNNIFWLGDCLEQRYQGKIYHSYNSSYLVVGEKSALLVETGHPKDFNELHEQIKGILSKKKIPLKYIFITHQETPHSGGVGRFLNIYPDVEVHGDINDYHMAFPKYAANFKAMEVGDSIDLGGMEFIAAEPVVRDMRTSLWGYISPQMLLFPADGFAYSHYHWDGHCGMIAEEADSLDLFDVSAVFAELALFWTNFVDMEIYTKRMEQLVDELGIKCIAPTHGLPILDVGKTMPKVMEGLQAPYHKLAS